METKPSIDEVREAFTQTLEDLFKAAMAARGDDRERLSDDRQVAADALTALNQEDIETRDAVFQKVAEQIQKDTIPVLAKLVEDIAGIVHVVDVSTKVAKNLTKALDLAARYFA